MVASAELAVVAQEVEHEPLPPTPMTPRPYDHNWQRIRLTILERDKNRCQLQLDGCEHDATHVDHIIPLSEGGQRLDPDNLRASCRPCNLRRNRQRQTELARHALTTLTSKSTPSRTW